MPKFELPDENLQKQIIGNITREEFAAAEYAGKDPEYENRSVMETVEGQKVMILNYLKDKGLYVVMNLDEKEVRSPAYRVSPNRLRKIEDNREKE